MALSQSLAGMSGGTVKALAEAAGHWQLQCSLASWLDQRAELWWSSPLPGSRAQAQAVATHPWLELVSDPGIFPLPA